MKPAPFDYVRPKTLDEALQLLASGEGEARILAGGQSLVAMMNLRFARPSLLIDINGLEDLDFVHCEGGVLRIGALARHATVASSPLIREVAPLIADAYQYVAHHTVRNRGTLAGNLCHADPASEMPAVMLVLEAEFLFRSATGQRVIRAADFFIGPYTTTASADEMLVEVRIPIQKAGSGFEEMSVRQGDFALTLVASTVTVADSKIKSAHIAYAGIGTCATRVPEAEQILIGQLPSDEVFGRAAEAAIGVLTLTSDVHADIEYRKDLIRTLTPRALRRAAHAVQT